MKIIRPDARERLAEALTLLDMVRTSAVDLVREQHLKRLERILESLYDSIEDRSE
jgi:hypothetical protein